MGEAAHGARTHAYVQTCVHPPHMHTLMSTCLHAHAHVHTQAHTHVDTHSPCNYFVKQANINIKQHPIYRNNRASRNQ